MKQQQSIEEILIEQIRQHEQQQEAAARAAAHSGELQQDIDNSTYGRRPVVLIAAVDNQGGFAKDKKIPWYYPEDFKWFKNRTTDKICVMGKNTYEEINEKLGNKAKESVLPNRKCFVVSSTLTGIENATVVRYLSDIEKHLDVDDQTPLYVIGGGRLFTEAIALADTVILTVINVNYECDQTFPVHYLTHFFRISQMFKNEATPDLRFTIWKRIK